MESPALEPPHHPPLRTLPLGQFPSARWSHASRSCLTQCCGLRTKLKLDEPGKILKREGKSHEYNPTHVRHYHDDDKRGTSCAYKPNPRTYYTSHVDMGVESVQRPCFNTRADRSLRTVSVHRTAGCLVTIILILRTHLLLGWAGLELRPLSLDGLLSLPKNLEPYRDPPRRVHVYLVFQLPR